VDELLRGVSDTALWVAMYRAMESERPDAIFHDPLARQMAGARGEAILASIPKARSMAWPMIVRTAVMDEIVMRLVSKGVRTVVNLAAGLDVRAYRLDLASPLLLKMLARNWGPACGRPTRRCSSPPRREPPSSSRSDGVSASIEERGRSRFA
jgi:hypothetical protein